MRRWELLFETVSRYFGAVGALAAVALAALIVYDSAMRYLFHEGSVALQELEWHLFDILFLMGMAYALKHDKHVRVDILYTRFSPKMKAWVKMATMLFFVIPFGLLIVWYGWDFALQSYLQHEGSPDPGGLCCRWMIKSVTVIAFVQLIFQALAETAKARRELKGAGA